MHIRLQTFRDKQGRLRHGRTVALRRSVFDTKQNKWRIVQLGTVDRFARELPRELKSILTKEEKEEFRQWAAARDQQVAELLQRHHLGRLGEYLGLAAKALEAGVQPQDAGLLWNAVGVLTRALEKAGYQKPIKERGRPTKAATLSTDDLVQYGKSLRWTDEHIAMFLAYDATEPS
ncbi:MULTISPECIES: hypothetical protein [Xanthomonas]|uniref:Uncharacterized protein n=3 Tax=Xanthomonas TaxID=338 RepID=A0A0U5G4C8_XANCI|nr:MULTISPECIES: hypothetical protein [Xanthomonas]ARR15308.1 hypothetical protein B7L66_24335 [Xanthomonas citri pv. citri]ARR20095.1 hypothetical protein B7L65_24690 [Xanthomonas citri pv. citri]ARR24667.1 hypothetical protein B7L67_24545 [Xanthomonas citri pv. citri]ATS86790.1 hypothetical protein XcfCFBP6991P_23165 [Xanthomonas citri pv. phaseoli var. fuscans]QRD58350.1 hypothetical protein H8Z75_23470 [Xanthomonas citri pv. citri]